MLLVTLLYPPCLKHQQTTPWLFKCSPTNALFLDETLRFTGQANKESLDWFFKGVCSSSWGILSPRCHSWSLWNCIWGVFLPSGGKDAPWECVPLADLLSVCPIYLGFYWVPLVHLSLLLVVCWHLLLLHHGPCPRGHPLMFRLHWPQRLSFRLIPSGAAFGLEIVNYSGKGLNPGRMEEECLRGICCSPGSLTHPGSPFFWIKTCSPL